MIVIVLPLSVIGLVLILLLLSLLGIFLVTARRKPPAHHIREWFLPEKDSLSRSRTSEDRRSKR